MTNEHRNGSGSQEPLSLLLARLNRELAPHHNADAVTDDETVRKIVEKLTPADRQRALMAVLCDAAVISRHKVRRSLIEASVFGGTVAVGLLVGTLGGNWTAARQHDDRTAAAVASDRPDPREEADGRGLASHTASTVAHDAPHKVSAGGVSSDTRVRPAGDILNSRASNPKTAIRETEHAESGAAATSAVSPDAHSPEATVIHTASLSRQARTLVAKRSGHLLAGVFAAEARGTNPVEVARDGLVLSEAPSDLPAVHFGNIVDLSRFTFPLSLVSVPAEGPPGSSGTARAADASRLANAPPPDALAESMSKVREVVQAGDGTSRSHAAGEMRSAHAPRGAKTMRLHPRDIRDESSREKPRRVASARRDTERETGSSGRGAEFTRARRVDATPSRPIVREQPASWLSQTLVGH